MKRRSDTGSAGINRETHGVDTGELDLVLKTYSETSRHVDTLGGDKVAAQYSIEPDLIPQG